MSSTVVDEVQEVRLEEWEEGSPVEDQAEMTLKCGGGCENELFRVKLGGKETGLLLAFFVLGCLKQCF